MGDQATIKDIFNQSQTGLQGHGKLIKSLTSVYKKVDYPSFQSQFFHCMKYPMIVFKREPAVERVIDFVAKFLLSLVKKDSSKEKEEKSEDDGGDDEEEDVDAVAENKLLQETFDFLLQHHSARERAVRFRCCQLINKLLANLGEDAQIDDELYDRLYECMLDRLKDKCPVVRYHAVLAMARLQDPGDENCPVIKAFLFLLNCDPNADVRRAVLTSIAPSTKTLSSIVGRTKDVKDTVRKTAYEVVSEKIHVKALSIAIRLQLLSEGLNDRSDAVQQTCSGKLLQVWFRTFGGSTLNLLKGLDVEDSTETCCTVVEALFKGSTLTDIVEDFKLLGDKFLIPEEELTSESVFYWQMICKYIHKLGTEGDESLDKVLPNCVDFCGYVKHYVDGLKTVEDPEIQLGKEFIIEQLLLIASYMDTADAASKKALETLLHNMMIADHVSHRQVKPLVVRICQLRGSQESLVQYFAELVSEIREPITVVEKDIAEEQKRQLNLKIASIRVKLNQYREELDEAVKSQDFTKAAELKTFIAELDEEKANLLEASEPAREEVRSERNDPLTIQKCQTIISEMLQSLNLPSVSPTLQMMIESQILPGIQNEDADVRNMAMKALGLCCFMSKDLLVTYLPLFMQASQIDMELVRVTALQVLFDLLLIYGLDLIDATESSEGSSGEDNPESTTTEEDNGPTDSSPGVASKLVAIICSFLDGESSELRTTAAEGLSKLLLSGRVVSPKILSHLILLWYNPLSEDDTHLRDCLGTFFPMFALGSRANQEIVEEAFLPTLNTLLNAPSTSPLAEVNVNNVAELLVPLTNTSLLTQNRNGPETSRDNPGHDNLSEKVCNEILSDPASPNVKLWIRILNQMEVSPDNEMVLKDLRILCYRISKTVKDKFCLKSLTKFHGMINELASKYVTNDEDLENIEIEVPQQPQEEEEEVPDDSIQTPKRKKRGLYSQNITLESDVMDLDLTQDVDLEIDASCLMRRSSTTSETQPKRSRKNTTELAWDDEGIFLKPDAPFQKGKETATGTEAGVKEACEDNQEVDAVEESETEADKVPEKRKSELRKTTPEKRPRIVGEEKSPEKGRSRSKERKQKSPSKASEKVTNKNAKSPQKASPQKHSKSPQKESPKKLSKSPQKASPKKQSKSPQKESPKKQSKSPTKASEKDSVTRVSRRTSKSADKTGAESSSKQSGSKSPDKRSSSKRKASASPSRQESASPGKRQRSTDVPSKPQLKRKGSPGRRGSQSPAKKSQSRDNSRNKQADLRQAKTSTTKSPSKAEQQKDKTNKDGKKNVRQTSSKNPEPVAKSKGKAPAKEPPSKNIQEETAKKDKTIDKSSPRKTRPRGSAASIVADTPEGQSRKAQSSKRPGISIAETPEMDSSPGSTRSVRSKGTPHSQDTPTLPTRSVRAVRGTPTLSGIPISPTLPTRSVRAVRGTPTLSGTPAPSTLSTRSVKGTPNSESQVTPKLGTRATRTVAAKTPDVTGTTPRVSARLNRSAVQTPEVASPKDSKVTKEKAMKKSDKSVAAKKTAESSTKKSQTVGATDRSESSSGSSSSEGQSKRKASSQSSGQDTQSQSDSSPTSTRSSRAKKAKVQRPVPAKPTKESLAASTTDEDEEEDQIRRRVKPVRKPTGTKVTGVKPTGAGKTSSPSGVTRASVREVTGSQSDTVSRKVRPTTQKSSSLASTTATKKPSTPKSLKSDSEEGSVFSSPGSARSTRSTRMTTDVTRGTRASNAKTVKNSSTTTAPTQANKSTRPKQLPRWK